MITSEVLQITAVAAGLAALLAEAPVAYTVLGAIFAGFEVLIDGTVGLTAGRLGDWLSRRRHARQALDAGAGTIMIGLAGRLALER